MKKEFFSHLCATATADEIGAHVLRQIRSSEANLAPCYHQILSPALPSTAYTDLIHRLPSVNEFRPARGAEHTRADISIKLGCQSSKCELWLPHLWDGTSPSRLRDEDVQPWFDVYAGLSSDGFRSDLMAIMGMQHSDGFRSSIRLVKESGAAYLKPHVDRTNKVLTIVFYLGDCLENGALGTNLYGPEPDTEDSDHLSVPFKANTGVFLPRLRDSWHAVTAHKLRAPRITLQYFLLNGGTG